MSLSDKGAVVIMHMQNEVIDPKGTVAKLGNAAEIERRGVLQNITALLTMARKEGWTVVHIGAAYEPAEANLASNVPLFAHHSEDGERFIGTWAADFYPEIAPVGDDLWFYHFGIVGFEGTPLAKILTVRGINRIYLGGVSTHMAILGTTFSGADRGYSVTVVEDCCAAANMQQHETGLESIRLFAQISTAGEVIAAQTAS